MWKTRDAGHLAWGPRPVARRDPRSPCGKNPLCDESQSDHLAARIEERPAGVTRIYRNIGLYEGHRRVPGQDASLGAHNSGGGAFLESIGLADSKYVITHGQSA